MFEWYVNVLGNLYTYEGILSELSGVLIIFFTEDFHVMHNISNRIELHVFCSISK